MMAGSVIWIFVLRDRPKKEIVFRGGSRVLVERYEG